MCDMWVCEKGEGGGSLVLSVLVQVRTTLSIHALAAGGILKGSPIALELCRRGLWVYLGGGCRGCSGVLLVGMWGGCSRDAHRGKRDGQGAWLLECLHSERVGRGLPSLPKHAFTAGGSVKGSSVGLGWWPVCGRGRGAGSCRKCFVERQDQRVHSGGVGESKGGICRVYWCRCAQSSRPLFIRRYKCEPPPPHTHTHQHAHPPTHWKPDHSPAKELIPECQVPSSFRGLLLRLLVCVCACACV